MEIERIKQLAREQGIDLKIQGLVCLPREIKKYTGSIWRSQRRRNVSYEVRIHHKDFNLLKTFKTEAEAEQYIRLTNVREGLSIRNRFTIFADRVLVDLPGNKLLICDYEDLDIVESYNWCCSNGYAATGTSSANPQYFHNLIMRHIPTEITVDHINRNCLDNCKSNLRLADRRIQIINRGRQVNNNSGVTGVSYNKKSKGWVAEWQDIDGNQCSKSFGSKKYTNDVTKAKAIEHRQRMIRSLPHYREALQLDDEA